MEVGTSLKVIWSCSDPVGLQIVREQNDDFQAWVDNKGIEHREEDTHKTQSAELAGKKNPVDFTNQMQYRNSPARGGRDVGLPVAADQRRRLIEGADRSAIGPYWYQHDAVCSDTRPH